MSVGLPQVESRSQGIGAHGHAAGVQDVERLHEDGAARFFHLGGRRVGAVDPHVGVPRWDWRRAFRLGADRSHLEAAQRCHVVVTARSGGHAVFEGPPEQIFVEGLRGVGIRLCGVDPAGDAGHVSVSLEHVVLLSVGFGGTVLDGPVIGRPGCLVAILAPSAVARTTIITS